MDVFEEKLGVERYPNLEVNKDMFIWDDKEKHGKG